MIILTINFSIISNFSFSQKVALEQSGDIEKKILLNDVHIYTIALQQGEYASCIVMQKGVDIGIDLINPAGKKLQTFDSPNGTDGPEPVNIIAIETGSYELHIYPMNDQSYLTDSASKAKFAQQNQGQYTITDVVKLSVTGYQAKLANEAADRILFTKWLITNSHSLTAIDAGNGYKDLQPFKQILKDVGVVGLGESSHGTSEFFRMKHRMLEFLVNEMGYNSFYIEASMARCRYINDYVLYGKGNLDTATVIQGFTTWRVEEVRNMIEWIRIHNKTLAADKKVKFMGYDLQGNDYAWKDLKQFYIKVKPSMNTLIDSLIKQSGTAVHLSNGSASEQDEGASMFKLVYTSCLGILNDISLSEGEYEYATSKLLYQRNLMNIKLILQEIESYKDGYNDRRDYYMAQNIVWLLNNEKPGAKVIVWAHNGHIEKNFSANFGTMGYYLSEYLGNKYYALGFEFYEGSFKTRNYDDINSQSRNWDIVTIGKPPVQSLPWYFNETGKSKLFIDFRNTGTKNISIFKQPFNMHSFGSGYSPKSGRIVFPDNLYNFDGMIYIKQSTAAKNFPYIMGL